MKRYICTGFSHKKDNGHLSGVVGDVHTLATWLEIAFPGRNAAEYFEGYSDKEVCDYLHENAKIRLESAKRFAE